MTAPIFFDTESTGLTGRDRVCQLSAVRFDPERRQFVDEFNEYINPQHPMSPEAQAVTGLTNEFLADKPPFAEVWPRFVAYVNGSEGIAHNSPFDVRMLNQELQRLDPELELSPVMPKVTDTARLARMAFPGKSASGARRSVSLDALPILLGLVLPPRAEHDAVDDCRRLALCYGPLMEIVGPKLAARERIMRELIGSTLNADSDMDAVIDHLCLLQDALAPLQAAEKAAKEALRQLLAGQPFDDQRIEVEFKPKQGNMDWARLKQDHPSVNVDAYRKGAPNPSMHVSYRI